MRLKIGRWIGHLLRLSFHLFHGHSPLNNGATA
jgi:hypothetical protein